MRQTKNHYEEATTPQRFKRGFHSRQGDHTPIFKHEQIYTQESQGYIQGAKGLKATPTIREPYNIRDRSAVIGGIQIGVTNTPCTVTAASSRGCVTSLTGGLSRSVTGLLSNGRGLSIAGTTIFYTVSCLSRCGGDANDTRGVHDRVRDCVTSTTRTGLTRSGTGTRGRALQHRGTTLQRRLTHLGTGRSHRGTTRARRRRRGRERRGIRS